MDWRDTYLMYHDLSEYDEKTPSFQLKSLLYTMGMPESKHVLDSLALSEEDKKKFAVVISKLDGYFLPARNIIHERSVFHKRVQRQHETIEEYLTDLHSLARNCSFEGSLEERIRDVLVIGMQDKECAMKIQLTKACSLKEAVEMARQHQMVKAQVSEQVQHVEDQHVKMVDKCEAQKIRQPTKQHTRMKSIPSAKTNKISRTVSFAEEVTSGARSFVPLQDKHVHPVEKAITLLLSVSQLTSVMQIFKKMHCLLER